MKKDEWMQPKDRTLHCRRDKKVLCGFTTEKPSKWPRGHFWLTFDQLGIVPAEGKVCEPCFERARELRAQEPSPP